MTRADHITKFTGNRVQAEFNVTLTDTETGQPAGSGTNTKEIMRLVNSEIGNNVSLAYMSAATDPSWDTQLGPDGIVWWGMQNVVDALTMPNTGYDVFNSDFNHFFDVMYPNWSYPGYVSDLGTINNRLIPTLQNPESRQFYCYAHGNPWELTDTLNNAKIDCRDLMFKLGNYIEPSAKINVVSNPYRFVFLDGCSTAVTRSWANAFGIFHYSDELEGCSVVGPQAFVGWGGPVNAWLGGPGVSPYDLNLERSLASAYCATLQAFYTFWMRGWTVAECIKQAETVGAPGCFAPFPTPLPPTRTSRVYIVKLVDGTRVGFYSRVPFNPHPGVDVYVLREEPLTSPIRVIGHQGLARYGCIHAQDSKAPYQWPDPGIQE